jgi:hypothetical protein
VIHTITGFGGDPRAKHSAGIRTSSSRTSR